MIQLNRKGIEELRGYFHEHDSLQHAFLHKSSEPKLSIPYDNPLYQGMPNQFTFMVVSRSVHESRDTHCLVEDNIDLAEGPSTDCYVKHLEDVLGCTLPWDGSRNECKQPELHTFSRKITVNLLFVFIACHRCQFPFVYKGTEYTDCSDKDAAFAWCPTAIIRDRTASESSWQFCNSSINRCESATCKSRETLEHLMEKILDLSRTSPRTIAEELHCVGCPFNCHYKEYSLELIQKKQDLSLNIDVLELKFKFQGKSSSAENVQKDLDYSIDMFISDLGNGFGFLLGLSLLGVIRVFINSGVSFATTALEGPLRLWTLVKSTFTLLKWTLVAVFVTYLTVLSFATDVSELISLKMSYSLKSVETGDSSLMNVNASKLNLKWGFQADIKENSSSCPYTSEIQDHFCDDKANVEECLFDGGDCCKPGSERRPNSHWFCSSCSCHLGNNDSLVLKPGLFCCFDNKNLSIIAIAITGMCELCLFPFVHENGLESVRKPLSEHPLPSIETSHDCVAVPLWNGRHFCPTAIHEDTMKPYGIPYQWPCPQEEYELQPSCFINPENGDIHV